MNFISLTSDLGAKDGSVAKIKARILSQNPDLKIIDISHDINPFDLYETAYIVRSSYQNFPENSIHLLLVDALQHPIQSAICAKLNQHFFLTNDTGLISLIQKNSEKAEARKLQNQDSPRFETFCETAIALAENPGYFESLGHPFDAKELTSMKPITKENQIVGTIVFVDNYGNAVSNISKSLFDEVGRQRNFEIFARNYNFNKLMKNYADVVSNFENESSFHGRNMALFNDNDFLEFALYKSNNNSVGGASQLLGLQIGEKVRVEFS